MAEQFAIRHRVPKAYTDFTRLLAEVEPDVVHVTCPPQLHHELAIQSMEAGSHVLVEKPLTIDLSLACDVLETAQRLKKKLTVAWGYYFDPVMRSLRRIAKKELLGEIVHLESFLSYDLKSNFGRSMLADSHHWIHSLPAGLFQNNLDHLINAVCEFVKDADPVVCARAWHSPRLWEEPDLADELRVSVFGTKVSANITFSSHCRPVSHYLFVHGTRGYAFVDLTNQMLTTSCSSSFPGALGRLTRSGKTAMQSGLQAWTNFIRLFRSELHYAAGMNFLIAAFYESIVLDLPVPISHDHLRRVSCLMDSVVAQINPTLALSK